LGVSILVFTTKKAPDPDREVAKPLVSPRTPVSYTYHISYQSQYQCIYIGTKADSL